MTSFNPINEPLLDGNEKKYLAECIDTGWISAEGPFVKRFEEAFAARMGRRHGIAVTKGTRASSASSASSIMMDRHQVSENRGLSKRSRPGRSACGGHPAARRPRQASKAGGRAMSAAPNAATRGAAWSVRGQLNGGPCSSPARFKSVARLSLSPPEVEALAGAELDGAYCCPVKARHGVSRRPRADGATIDARRPKRASAARGA
jgi:hypothetical protein